MKIKKSKKITFLIDDNKFYRVAISEDEIPMGDYMKSEMFLEFIKMLIFIEFSDVTEVLLKPNQSIGTKKQGKYLNDSKNNFILVDSKWTI